MKTEQTYTYTYETRSGDAAAYGDLDEAIAIIRADHPGCVINNEWEPEGEGRERRLVWESAEDAEDDDGGRAIGALVREAE